METNVNTPAMMAKTESDSDSPRRWLGIDFSGNCDKWSSGCRTSNVWFAEVIEQGNELCLERLGRVQTLPSPEAPFRRLVARLQKRDFCGAGIDAPFSVPSDFISDGGHDALLALVKRIPLGNRPFPDAQTFANTVIAGRAMTTAKPLRRTEREWQDRGVNVRSTLWTGPRGGAAMTAACLTLLGAVEGHVWPWCLYRAGIMAEAFPAAQLKTWQLPHQQYNNSDRISVSNRQQITRALKQRIALGDFESQLQASADALDAVLCAFAAVAITLDLFVPIPSGYPRDEGWIAVHI